MLHIKAETAYDVAKERCDDLSGPAKDLCIDEAKARKKKAVADVNLSAHIGDAQPAPHWPTTSSWS